MNENFDLTANSLFESLLGKSFEIDSEEEKPMPVSYLPPMQSEEFGELPLFDEEDRDILMHRDVHFSSNFDLMLEQYEEEAPGACLDVTVDRIRFLQELEAQLGYDLAPILLQGADAERVGVAKRVYQALRMQHEAAQKQPLVAAIADLILEEEEPEEKARVAAQCGQELVPYLIQLIEAPLFYDPLFPGYGQAPLACALTLGELKASSAIQPLFERIGNENFEVESAVLCALAKIGSQSNDFCVKQLKARPMTKNNERAAILASMLDKDEPFYEVLLQELEDLQIQKNERLATYLVLACSELPKKLLERFKKIAKQVPEAVQEEMQHIIKSC